MMKVYEDLTGIKFAFNKYDQTVVAGFHFRRNGKCYRDDDGGYRDLRHK
jgi:hypothetical protein